MTYNLADYWDFAAPGKSFRQHWYYAPTNLLGLCVGTYTADFGGCTKYEEFFGAQGSDGTIPWTDTWYYRSDAKRGLIEAADEFPKTGWANLLFWSGLKREVYLPGKEIVWGGEISADGEPFTNAFEIDYSQSVTAPPFKGAWSTGQQTCWFTHLPTFTDNLGRVHSDVLVVQNAQSIGGGAIQGAKYYCRKGIGRVAVEFLEYNADYTVRTATPMAAAVYKGSIILG